MKNLLTLAYGLVTYAIFFATFLYTIGFMTGYIVPKTVSGEAAEGGAMLSALINIALIALFAAQHSIMARPSFKRWWTKIVSPAIERSTYVLASSLAMIALFYFWQPMAGQLWNFEQPVARVAMHCLTAVGFLIVLYSSFLIDHFDLFGLRQVFLKFKNTDYTDLEFKKPGIYSLVRHPIYLGWIVASWATPAMSYSHLVLAVGNSVYILGAIFLEERNLVQQFGDHYKEYKDSTPMLIPLLPKVKVS